MPSRLKLLSCRVPDPVFEGVEQAAAAEGRSLGGWISWTIQLRLRELGLLSSEPLPVRQRKRGRK